MANRAKSFRSAETMVSSSSDRKSDDQTISHNLTLLRSTKQFKAEMSMSGRMSPPMRKRKIWPTSTFTLER